MGVSGLMVVWMAAVMGWDGGSGDDCEVGLETTSVQTLSGDNGAFSNERDSSTCCY